MAGYSGFSISNNEGESELAAASQVARRIPPSLVRKFCRPKDEQHHTSCHYNTTDSFSLSHVRGVFGLDGPDHADFDARAVAALNEHNEYLHNSNDQSEIHHNCRVVWLEWRGTRNPGWDERCAEGRMVRIKGETAYITFRDGTEMVESLATYGFRINTEDSKFLKAKVKSGAATARAAAREAKDLIKRETTAMREVLKARGARLPKALCPMDAPSGMAWAALTESGCTVLAVRMMNGTGTMNFNVYREAMLNELADIGTVASGYLYSGHGVFEICSSDIKLFESRSYQIPDHLDLSGRPLHDGQIRIPAEMLHLCLGQTVFAAIDDDRRILALFDPTSKGNLDLPEAIALARQLSLFGGRLYECNARRDYGTLEPFYEVGWDGPLA